MKTFIPEFDLTFISTVSGKNESFDNWDIADGIFDADHIQGFLGSISKFRQINNPLTLYQFVPKNKKFGDDRGNELVKEVPEEEIDSYFKNILNDVKLIRLDSDRLFSIEYCCSVFRDYFGKLKDYRLKECQMNDSRVALLYNKEDRSFCTNRERLRRRITDYNLSREENVEIGEFKDRFYLKYRCCISNLDEYLFPVLYQNKLMAVLVMGRVSHPDFCHNIDYSFCDQENQEKILSDLAKIESTDNETITEKINEIFWHVYKFEKRIESAIEHAKQKIINESFEKIKTDFQRKSLFIDLNKQDALKEIGNLASEALKKICLQFPDNKFIRIFAALNFNQPTSLKLFASSDEERDEWSHFNIDLGPLRDKRRKKEGSMYRLIKLENDIDERQEVVKAFSLKNAIHKDDALRILPTTSPKVSFIIWKRYKEGWVEQNESTNEVYRNALIDLYILIAQAYASLVGYVNEKGLENSIRIAGHEAGQIIPRILQSLDKIFTKSQNSLTSDIAQGRFYWDIEDIYNQVTLTHNIYEKSRLVFRDIEVTERENKHLSEILVKMAKIFRPLAAHKKNSIPEPGVLGKKIDIKIEEHYFEHVLYNLLDNAVKYAYDGSYIYINVEEKEMNLIISVTSYGQRIEDGEKIYELYFRSDTLKSQHEGLGVGMFVARKVAEAHGFKLMHTTERLSPNNLPALYANADSYKGLFDNTKEDAFHEVVVLKGQEPLFKPGKIETDKLIHMPTFRNKFSIIIPDKYFSHI